MLFWSIFAIMPQCSIFTTPEHKKFTFHAPLKINQSKNYRAKITDDMEWSKCEVVKIRRRRYRDKDNKTKPSSIFIINCVSLASLTTSRDILGLIEYKCWYLSLRILSIDKRRKKVFTRVKAWNNRNKISLRCPSWDMTENCRQTRLQIKKYVQRKNMVSSFNDTWYPKFCLQMSIQLSVEVFCFLYDTFLQFM